MNGSRNGEAPFEAFESMICAGVLHVEDATVAPPHQEKSYLSKVLLKFISKSLPSPVRRICTVDEEVVVVVAIVPLPEIVAPS